MKFRIRERKDGKFFAEYQKSFLGQWTTCWWKVNHYGERSSVATYYAKEDAEKDIELFIKEIESKKDQKIEEYTPKGEK